MFCKFLLYSSDQVTHINIFFFLTLSIMFFKSGWYSSLCYTAGSYFLSTLNAIVCIYKTPAPCPSHSPPPPPWQSQVCSPCPWVSLFSVDRFTYAIYYIPYINDIIWYLSFSFWLTSISMRISSSIHVDANGISLSFYGWVIFHCIYVAHLLNQFICWWTFRLFQYLGYCK